MVETFRAMTVGELLIILSPILFVALLIGAFLMGRRRRRRAGWSEEPVRFVRAPVMDLVILVFILLTLVVLGKVVWAILSAVMGR